MSSKPGLIATAFVAALAQLGGCASDSLATRIPPAEATQTRLAVARTQLDEYWQQSGRVPEDLRELPAASAEAGLAGDQLSDGWGREFNWTSDGIANVRIWSLGRDGQPGGAGDDADAELIYRGPATAAASAPQNASDQAAAIHAVSEAVANGAAANQQ